MLKNLMAVVMTFALSLNLAGCAGAGLALFGVGAGVAAGTSVDYTLNGIAYKTYTASTDDLHFATRDALRHMAIKVKSDRKTDNGWEIDAVAGDREIGIEIERLTPNAARLRVVANKQAIFKDRATANEIIGQTNYAVDDRLTLRQARK